MKIKEILTELSLKTITGEGRLDREIGGGYASDLLSNAMGQAKSGSVWITMQTHQNIIAVASLLDLAAIIIAGGSLPDQQTIAKAKRENVVLLTTHLSTYEAAGRLYELGIRHS